jgi:methenyltetrahydrofolate cyclohydrolase
MTAAISGSSVGAFLEALASDAPTPGGGAVAALTAAAGAGLISMVGRLTLGKTGYEDAWSRMEELIAEADAARDRFLDLGERDATAFDGVIAALRLPKATEREKAVRSEAIQRGYERAAEVPLDIARAAVELLPLALEATERGNAHATSDGVCAAELLAAAARCAGANVQINAAAMKDRARSARLLDDVATLRARADQLVASTSETFVRRLPS